MGRILAVNQAANLEREFTCAQYAHLNDILPAGWVVAENSCGQYFELFRSPEAAFGLTVTGATVPGGWVSYEAVISSNRVIIPTAAFRLPSNPDNVRAIVRRQEYHPNVAGDVRDFAVNLIDNSIDFLPSLGLNGQTCYVKVFK